MGLILLLLILVIVCGGFGFTGVVALGSLAVLVKILFALLLIGLIVSVIRHFFYGPPVDPYAGI